MCNPALASYANTRIIWFSIIPQCSKIITSKPLVKTFAQMRSILFFLFFTITSAVLRYPDIDWELRHHHLTVQECFAQQNHHAVTNCLQQLRHQLLADTDCTQVVPAFWLHISILEGWRVNTTCGDGVLLFTRLWDQGFAAFQRGGLPDVTATRVFFEWFLHNQTATPDLSPLTHREEPDPRAAMIANSSATILYASHLGNVI